MNQNKISFVLWGLYDKEESSVMLKPEADKGGDWTQSQLTEMGIYSRKIVGGGINSTGIIFLITGIIVLAAAGFVIVRGIRFLSLRGR